jgi:hypothetical protein
VPLTQSLYVPGQLADTNSVIVDVGTGFYVEKSTADAIKFYNGKVDDLSKNLGDLEKVVQGKNENLRIVEEGQSIQTTACHLLRGFGHLLMQMRDCSVTAESNGGTGFYGFYGFSCRMRERESPADVIHGMKMGNTMANGLHSKEADQREQRLSTYR